jgi:hypothetical protein
MRQLILAHRYLGMAIGLLMVMWCLSGVVMMYVSYPSLAARARIEHLAPLEWRDCCRISQALAQSVRVGNSHIEMLAGRPVLFLDSPSDPRPIDLLTGSAIVGITADEAASVASLFSGRAQNVPLLLGLIDHDQWTVSGDFNAQRPLFHFALDDAARTELYVSSITGRAVQITTAHERFWNWLGAVPHWLYFTELRRNASLWSHVVIYASLLGCFLAGIGIYLGVRQMLAQPAARWSPYFGLNLWHHMAGLIFGIFSLSWVLSGLLSMNPWGWLESAGTQSESAAIRGAPDPSPAIGAAAMTAALQAFAGSHIAALSLQAAPLNGKLYFVAVGAQGMRQRFDAAAAAAPLTAVDLSFLSRILSGSESPQTAQLMGGEDNWYFSHHPNTVTLPVYRITRAGSGTRYYVDSVSGMLIAKLDLSARRYRWLHEGLHRMDFTAWLRARPRWDALMLALMAGVTAVCGTGAYLGCRRLLRLL